MNTSDNSWGGPWATATIIVAGEPAETPTPEPGTIDTLAATDDDTGQLVLTWGPPAAPNADPTDYHINWAKSTESYPADTAEAGNAHPDSTTHTLASLEYDTDYNIRVRARYTDGENADSPWNGPWTETTAQVKLPLPMALNLMGAAVSPENKVFLFWSDPSMIPSLVIRSCAALMPNPWPSSKMTPGRVRPATRTLRPLRARPTPTP